MTSTIQAAAPSSKRSERMVELLARLNSQGELPLSDLAKGLRASEATIRRDVAVLAEQGLLIRTHGGARPINGLTELPFSLRDGRNRAAKQVIAKHAATLIPQGVTQWRSQAAPPPRKCFARWISGAT